MPRTFDLTDRTILVTGATGHLGAAISQQLAASGAKVLLNGRNAEKLAALKQDIGAVGQAEIVMFDIKNESEIAEHIGQLAVLHGLVNNAYAGTVATVENSTLDDKRASLEMNVTAPFGLIQTCLPLLRVASPGTAAIVNIASMYGMVSPDPRIYGNSGMNNPPFYGAGKAALIQLTRYLACHLAAENIRVNAISPGPFPPQSIKSDNPEFHTKLAAKVPMERIGLADEVGGAVQFLLSDAASYITGVNLPIDGGWTAGSN